MEIIEILRQYRIGPFTIFDTALAYGAIFLLAPLLTKLFLKINVSFSRTDWLWLTLPIAVIFHFVLQQHTPFMEMLLNPNDFYIAKIVLLLMLYMGLRKKRLPKHVL